MRAYMLNGECYRLLIFRYILLIAYGCYLYGHEERSNKKDWLMFFVGINFIVLTDYLGYKPITVKYWQRTCVYAILYFLPLFGYAMRHWKNVGCRPLELLGRASYHIFFSQMLYYNYWDERVGLLVTKRWIHLIVNIVVTICIGIAFFYVETPFSRFILKRADRLELRTHTKRYG